MSFSLVVVSRGSSLVAVSGLLITVTSLVEHELWDAWASVVAAGGLSSCGSPASEHRFSSCGAWT